MESRNDVILDHHKSDKALVVDADATDFISKTERRQIVKNLLVVSAAFLLLFTAFQSLSNLQSSLNHEEGLGFASLCVIYASLIVSCLFVPPLAIDKLGLKWTIVAAMTCYSIYTAANFYSTWWTLIPASVLLGFAAAPLWSAKCAYLTTTGIRYSKLTNQSQDHVVTRFFGIFFMIFQSGQIWGNLISSLVLKPSSGNGTRENASYAQLHCGALDCPLSSSSSSNASVAKEAPSTETVITLMSIYLACSMMGILVVIVFLDKLKFRNTNRKGLCTLFVATILHLKDKRMLLLIPLTMFSGLEQGFVFGDFTKSFITCTVGVEKVGFIMICFGVTDAFFSFALGKLSQYTGRPVLMVAGAIVNAALLVFLILWRPTSSDLAIFFVAAAVWGFADAIWQTQVNAFYGFLFPDNQEAAFANYRLWESLGFVIAFSYANSLCVSVKIYILLAVLAVGIALYCVIEVRQRKTTSNTMTLQEHIKL